MLQIMVVGFVVALAVFAIFVARQPDEFRVTRSLVMPASPERVFAQVNELQKWGAWSPWVKLDPNARNAFEGPAAGVGAKSHWAGNSKVGEGSMTITESLPNEFIKFQLDFVKPMRATNTAEFSFAAEGSQTKVSWTMYGKNSFLGKAMGLIFNCEKMVGGQFEQGLASLKSVVEAKS